MTTLTKVMTRREYPLFFCFIWSESDRVAMRHWVGEGIHNVLLVGEGGGAKVTVWYDKSEYDPEGRDRFDRAILERVATDSAWFDSVLSEFDRTWQLLYPYITQQQSLNSQEELRAYYDSWLAWWAVMSLTFIIPDIPQLPALVRQAALAAREKTQDYSDDGGQVLDQYFSTYFPAQADSWRLLLPEEMFSLGQASSADLVADRHQGWVLFNGELLLFDTYEAELGSRGIQLEKITVAELSEIKGKVASPGYAKGVVRIVASSQDAREVKPGEILVTEMTTPEFVPAMKRAAAIVTDEGGITCHAAIVSRELSKPCIIGTKIATQALSDGDRVEVDAERGAIHVLQRASAASLAQEKTA